PFFSWTRASRYAEQAKFGVIPIGRLARRRLRSVVHFGEAGLLQSPLFGGAFNEALVHAASFADSIESSLRVDKEEWFRVAPRHSLQKTVNDAVQAWLVKNLVDGTTDQMQRLVDLMGSLGERSSCRLLLGELSTRDLGVLGIEALATWLRSNSNGSPNGF